MRDFTNASGTFTTHPDFLSRSRAYARSFPPGRRGSSQAVSCTAKRTSETVMVRSSPHYHVPSQSSIIAIQPNPSGHQFSPQRSDIQSARCCARLDRKCRSRPGGLTCHGTTRHQPQSAKTFRIARNAPACNKQIFYPARQQHPIWSRTRRTDLGHFKVPNPSINPTNLPMPSGKSRASRTSLSVTL